MNNQAANTIYYVIDDHVFSTELDAILWDMDTNPEYHSNDDESMVRIEEALGEYTWDELRAELKESLKESFKGE